MVARVLFPELTCKGNVLTSPALPPFGTSAGYQNCTTIECQGGERHTACYRRNRCRGYHSPRLEKSKFDFLSCRSTKPLLLLHSMHTPCFRMYRHRRDHYLQRARQSHLDSLC